MTNASREETGPCRICGKTNLPMADAHIFPKAVFKRVKAAQGQEPFLLALDRDGAKPPKKVRIGEYDPNLLCVGCEQDYSPIDDRGLRSLLGTPFVPVPPYAKKQLVLKYSDKANALDIRLFLLFILLRASWSTREAYRHVQFGSDLERHILKAIQDGIEPGGIDLRMLLFQHRVVKDGLLSTPAVHSGAIIVWPGQGKVIFRLGIFDLSALILFGETVLTTAQPERLSLQAGKRVQILQSGVLDAQMEGWVAEMVVDRIRSGGGQWDRDPM